MSMDFSFAPNQITIEDSYTTDTNWHVLATDGSGYTTIALLLAAGKTLFPNLSPTGTFCQGTVFRSIATGGVTDGGPFFFQINRATAPTDATAKMCSGSGQQFVEPGSWVNTVWLRKPTSTDVIEVSVYY